MVELLKVLQGGRVARRWGWGWKIWLDTEVIFRSRLPCRSMLVMDVPVNNGDEGHDGGDDPPSVIKSWKGENVFRCTIDWWWMTTNWRWRSKAEGWGCPTWRSKLTSKLKLKLKVGDWAPRASVTECGEFDLPVVNLPVWHGPTRRPCTQILPRCDRGPVLHPYYNTARQISMPGCISSIYRPISRYRRSGKTYASRLANGPGLI